MFKIFSKIFGTKSERDLKDLTPYVDKVNAEYVKLTSLSNDELRDSSDALKKHIAEQLKA